MGTDLWQSPLNKVSFPAGFCTPLHCISDSEEGIGMLKTVSALNSLLSTALSLVIVVALAIGGWFAYKAYFGDRWALEQSREKLEEKEKEIAVLSGDLAKRKEEIQLLNKDVAAKQREIERLDTALRLLKVNHRVAQVDVLWQGPSTETGELITRISFVEVDDSGKRLEKPRTFTIEGDIVHVAALVVKFADKDVEMGDLLRGTSLYLFKRIYGDKQKPENGFVLDAVGSRPAAYQRGAKMSDWEQGLWSEFWDYANDPEKAKRAGVRAAHGEAVYQKMRPGKRYKVFFRSTGELWIEPEDRPPEETGQTF
jgi:uncharacterized coiled-coil protein SlyX